MYNIYYFFRNIANIFVASSFEHNFRRHVYKDIFCKDAAADDSCSGRENYYYISFILPNPFDNYSTATFRRGTINVGSFYQESTPGNVKEFSA